MNDFHIVETRRCHLQPFRGFNKCARGNYFLVSFVFNVLCESRTRKKSARMYRKKGSCRCITCEHYLKWIAGISSYFKLT